MMNMELELQKTVVVFLICGFYAGGSPRCWGRASRRSLIWATCTKLHHMIWQTHSLRDLKGSFKAVHWVLQIFQLKIHIFLKIYPLCHTNTLILKNEIKQKKKLTWQQKPHSVWRKPPGTHAQCSNNEGRDIVINLRGPGHRWEWAWQGEGKTQVTYQNTRITKQTDQNLKIFFKI